MALSQKITHVNHQPWTHHLILDDEVTEDVYKPLKLFKVGQNFSIKLATDNSFKRATFCQQGGWAIDDQVEIWPIREVRWRQQNFKQHGQTCSGKFLTFILFYFYSLNHSSIAIVVYAKFSIPQTLYATNGEIKTSHQDFFTIKQNFSLMDKKPTRIGLT